MEENNIHTNENQLEILRELMCDFTMAGPKSPDAMQCNPLVLNAEADKKEQSDVDAKKAHYVAKRSRILRPSSAPLFRRKNELFYAKQSIQRPRISSNQAVLVENNQEQQLDISIGNTSFDGEFEDDTESESDSVCSQISSTFPDDTRFPPSTSQDFVSKNAALAILLESLPYDLQRLGFSPEKTKNILLDMQSSQSNRIPRSCHNSFSGWNNNSTFAQNVFADLFMQTVDELSNINSAIQSMLRPANSDDIIASGDLTEEVTPSEIAGNFPWPVVEMAEYEFSGSCAGTRFDCVVVFIDLPILDHEGSILLHELLEAKLFQNIANPFHVILPEFAQPPINAPTDVEERNGGKGIAFVEFETPNDAERVCFAANGLRWHPYFHHMRARIFRDYHADNARPAASGNNDDGIDFISCDEEEDEVAKKYLEFSRKNNLEQNCEIRGFDNDETDQNDASFGTFSTIDDDSSFNGNQNFGNERILDEKNNKSDEEKYDDENDAVSCVSFTSSGYDGRLECQDLSSISSCSTAEEMECHDTCEDGEVITDMNIEHKRQYRKPRKSSPSDRNCTGNESYHDLNEMDENSFIYHVDPAWRRYCRELVSRNREMNTQLLLAQKRISQLNRDSHRIQQIMDNTEKDLLTYRSDNDQLRRNLSCFLLREERQQDIIDNISVLRKRLKKSERARGEAISKLRKSEEIGSRLRTRLQHLTGHVLHSLDLSQIKDIESVLEKSLNRLRTVKEEKIQQQKLLLNRRVEEQNELKLCVVCMANEKSVLCLPCRHLCICVACSDHEEMKRCPVCRINIEQKISVYS